MDVRYVRAFARINLRAHHCSAHAYAARDVGSVQVIIFADVRMLIVSCSVYSVAGEFCN